MTSKKRKNTRRIEVEAVIRDLGPMSRLQLQTHFGVHQATMQEHLTALRGEKKIYIANWEAPEGESRQWSPLYAVRVTGQERDMLQPPSVRRAKREGLPLAVLFEEDDKQIVVRGEGVKNEHALMARARGEEAGMWGGLLVPMREEPETRKPRMSRVAATAI